MIKTYKFFGESPLEFEDSKTVKELVEYAFDKFNYYEPFGMDTVTIFQCHHPKSNKGWFTTDTKKNVPLKFVTMMNFVLLTIFRVFFIMRKVDGGIIWRH